MADVTATAQSFSQIVSTTKWWADNIGQLFGAFLGALVAYEFGAHQTKRLKKQEDAKHEQDRLMHLTFFYEDTAELRQALLKSIRESIIYLQSPATMEILPFNSPIGIHKIYLTKREFFERGLSDAVINLRNECRGYNYAANVFNDKFTHPGTAMPPPEAKKKRQDDLISTLKMMLYCLEVISKGNPSVSNAQDLPPFPNEI